MKKLLLISLLGAISLATSCTNIRTMAPIDPMTLKPSDRCLPGVEVDYSGK